MAADDLDENAAMLARVLVASIDASGTPTESPDFEILFGDFAAETPAVGADELLWAFKKCTCRNRCCALFLRSLRHGAAHGRYRRPAGLCRCASAGVSLCTFHFSLCPLLFFPNTSRTGVCRSSICARGYG